MFFSNYEEIMSSKYILNQNGGSSEFMSINFWTDRWAQSSMLFLDQGSSMGRVLSGCFLNIMGTIVYV